MKRGLGISYLIGTGLALAVALALGFPLGGVDRATPIGTTSGILLSLSLAYTGYWLDRLGLEDDQIWRVAKLGSLGIGAFLLASTGVLAVYREPGTVPVYPGMLVSNLAAGGLVGVLWGTVGELREENRTVRRLNERNGVLTRVLRHNIRNDVNVITGYAASLEDECGDRETALAAIQKKADEIAELSEKARRIEHVLARDGERTPAPVTATVRAEVDRLRTQHPEATVSIDAPDDEVRAGDERLGDLVASVLENAIEHADADPEATVSVEAIDRADGAWVEIAVADTGPGIPRLEQAAIAKGDEAPLEHGSGLGLWIAKWLVDRYGGELAFEENDPAGTVVVVRLPRATDRGTIFGGHPDPATDEPDPTDSVPVSR